MADRTSLQQRNGGVFRVVLQNGQGLFNLHTTDQGQPNAFLRGDVG